MGKSSRSPNACVGKPVRPLTIYHLFFQLEREYLIQNIKSSCDEPTTDHIGDDRHLGIDIDPEMPARYKKIYLTTYWFASSSGKRIKTKESEKRRNHRKVHGKISFQELSKQIAARWKTLEVTDEETKMYCAKIAKRELDLYMQKMKQYKENVKLASEKQGNDASCNSTEMSKFSTAYSQAPHSSAPGSANVTANNREGTSMDPPVKKRKQNGAESERVMTAEVSLARLESTYHRISSAMSDLIPPQNNQQRTMPPSYLHNTVHIPSRPLAINSVPYDNKFKDLLAIRKELDANMKSLLFIRRELAECQEIASMEYFHLRNSPDG